MQYGYDEGIISLSMILHTIPLFVALYYSLKNNKDKNIDYYTLFIPCVSLILAPFVQVTQILSRFSFYFEIFCIIQYPILLSMSKNNIVKYCLCAIMIMSILYKYYQFFVGSVYTPHYLIFKTIFD